MTKTRKILAIHSKARAKLRYGVDINKATRRLLIQQIQTNQAQFVQTHTRRVKEFIVTLDGKPMRVLYDSNRSTIITFLPPEDSEEYKAAKEVHLN